MYFENINKQSHVSVSVHTRAGVLVLGTRTRSAQVMNFWYPYFIGTQEL